MIDRQQRSYHTQVLPSAACSACGKLTPWKCWMCWAATCATCQCSMYALCQPCRTGYTGPINVLGKRSDAHITAEFERMFA